MWSRRGVRADIGPRVNGDGGTVPVAGLLLLLLFEEVVVVLSDFLLSNEQLLALEEDALERAEGDAGLEVTPGSVP
jgi:hypothetical protein